MLSSQTKDAVVGETIKKLQEVNANQQMYSLMHHDKLVQLTYF